MSLAWLEPLSIELSWRPPGGGVTVGISGKQSIQTWDSACPSYPYVLHQTPSSPQPTRSGMTWLGPTTPVSASLLLFMWSVSLVFRSLHVLFPLPGACPLFPPHKLILSSSRSQLLPPPGSPPGLAPFPWRPHSLYACLGSSLSGDNLLFFIGVSYSDLSRGWPVTATSPAQCQVLSRCSVNIC